MIGDMAALIAVRGVALAVTGLFENFVPMAMFGRAADAGPDGVRDGGRIDAPTHYGKLQQNKDTRNGATKAIHVWHRITAPARHDETNSPKNPGELRRVINWFPVGNLRIVGSGMTGRVGFTPVRNKDQFQTFGDGAQSVHGDSLIRSSGYTLAAANRLGAPANHGVWKNRGFLVARPLLSVALCKRGKSGAHKGHNLPNLLL
jgi:hypothetical protein